VALARGLFAGVTPAVGREGPDIGLASCAARRMATLGRVFGRGRPNALAGR
jgi:hypothetical protein